MSKGFSKIVRQMTGREPLSKSTSPPSARSPYADLPKINEDAPHRHYFMDTEFMEDGARGKGSIDLISIGIVDEDGRTFYAINREADLSKANDFVQKQVVPKLPPRDDPAWMSPEQIAEGVLAFLRPDEREPHMWTWYGAYDHVVFCWLFGTMSELPDGLAMFARDLKLMLPFFEANCGQRIYAPSKPRNAHDALADAVWLKDYWGEVEKMCGELEWFKTL